MAAALLLGRIAGAVGLLMTGAAIGRAISKAPVRVTAEARKAGWHAGVPLGDRQYRITVRGKWSHKQGEPTVGPGGSRIVAHGDFPKTIDGATEGCLLVRVLKDGAVHHFADGRPLVVQGPGTAEFRINDTAVDDNIGTLEIHITPVL